MLNIPKRLGGIHHDLYKGYSFSVSLNNTAGLYQRKTSQPKTGCGVVKLMLVMAAARKSP